MSLICLHLSLLTGNEPLKKNGPVYLKYVQENWWKGSLDSWGATAGQPYLYMIPKDVASFSHSKHGLIHEENGLTQITLDVVLHVVKFSRENKHQWVICIIVWSNGHESAEVRNQTSNRASGCLTRMRLEEKNGVGHYYETLSFQYLWAKLHDNRVFGEGCCSIV